MRRTKGQAIPADIDRLFAGRKRQRTAYENRLRDIEKRRTAARDANGAAKPSASSATATLVERVAAKGQMSQAEAREMVNLVLGEIKGELKNARKTGRFTVGTFGTFIITKRAARKGRNPATGEEITIKASKGLRFKPAAQLKRAAGVD